MIFPGKVATVNRNKKLSLLTASSNFTYEPYLAIFLRHGSEIKMTVLKNCAFS